MTDLVAGRYAPAEEEWILDGMPVPPYRRTISRRDIASGASGLAATATTILTVFPVPVQAGDIFNFASLLSAVAGATLTHSWVAIYNGTVTGAALLAQVADNTTATGWAVGAQKLALTAAVSDIGQPGTPQGPAGGPGSWALTAAAPAIWGIGVYQSGTTVNLFDAMPGSGALNGAVAVTGQAPMVTKSGVIGATGIAPAVLPAMTPGNGAVPYMLLSRQ
jgi:hypothetical protein